MSNRCTPDRGRVQPCGALARVAAGRYPHVLCSATSGPARGRHRPTETQGGRRVLQYIVVGLVLGSIYALAASGLVITYVSTGVLNFAFGAFAFFVARTYYHLHIEKGWGIVPAAAVRASASSRRPGAVLLPGDLPLPAPLDPVDQGRRDHRPLGRGPGFRGRCCSATGRSSSRPASRRSRSRCTRSSVPR